MEGINRLKKQLEGQNDNALIQVVDYLCSRKDMDARYMNEEKTLSGMANYIKENARKIAKNGWNFVNDKVVYAWAVTYFLFSDKHLGIEKPKTSSKATEKKSKKVEKETENVSNKSNVIDINTAKEKIKEPVPEVEQITLFGGM